MPSQAQVNKFLTVNIAPLIRVSEQNFCKSHNLDSQGRAKCGCKLKTKRYMYVFN